MKSTGNIVYKVPSVFQKKVPVGSFYLAVSKLRDLGFVPEYKGLKLFRSLLSLFPKEQ